MAPRALPERLAASRRRIDPPAGSPPAPKSKQPPSPPPRFRWQATIAVVCIAAVTLAATFGVRPAAEAYLLRQWTSELTNLPENADPAPLIAQAAQQGEWGLRLVVAATNSPNERAQRAAVVQLRAQLDQWLAEPNIDHSADVQNLVHLLAANHDQYSPDQLARLLPVVERLTAWPVLLKQPALAEYLADSEVLVRLMASVPPPTFVEEPAIATQPPAEAPPAQVARLPNDSSPPTSPAEVPSNEVLPTSPDDIPTPLPNPPLILEMLPETPREVRPLNNVPPRESRGVIVPRSSSEPDERRFQSWADWQVIRLLQHAADSQEAETELRLRGYLNRDLDIARRAVHPEPAIRLQLVEDLPRITNIDARLWLRQLAEDSDRDVRAAAAAVLRTAYNGPLSGREK